jgi:uncharacterized coiled-coil protein SlyX
MYLEQRVEKLESMIARLEAELEEYRVTGAVKVEQAEKNTYPLYWRLYGSDEVGIIRNDDEYSSVFETRTEVIDLISEDVFNELRLKNPTETDYTDEPEQAKTLDDVRAAVTQVMKADKTKKQALQALLKKHGADRVSELDESKFAIVIDTIEKGEF